MMKKSNWLVGIAYLLVGAACLAAALLTETKLDGVLFGLAGAGIGPGLVMIYKYFYWSAAKNRQRYQEKLENERIERHDELKEKLRDRAGRYAYVCGLMVISLSMLVFTVLDSLEAVESARLVIFYLAGLLAFQIVSGIVIFNRLLKKY